MCPQNFNSSSILSKEEILCFLNSHHDKLEQVAQTFLLEIHCGPLTRYLFLITPQEVLETEDIEKNLPLISLDFETLKKILENPSRAIRFYFQGKIKIQGNVRDLFKNPLTF